MSSLITRVLEIYAVFIAVASITVMLRMSSLITRVLESYAVFIATASITAMLHSYTSTRGGCQHFCYPPSYTRKYIFIYMPLSARFTWRNAQAHIFPTEMAP